MGILKKIILVTAVSFAANGANANLVVCTKNSLQWGAINDGKLGASGFGPAIIINAKANRVTWIGTGGYIQVTGLQTSEGVKIIRIDGRPTQERILSTRQNGRITDYELEDSLGGVGLLRVSLDSANSSRLQTGSATWQHTTDSSKENLAFCTTHVLND